MITGGHDFHQCVRSLSVELYRFIRDGMCLSITPLATGRGLNFLDLSVRLSVRPSVRPFVRYNLVKTMFVKRVD